ncbi:hypothetical protein D3C77_594730 [compost metagenome]
MAEPGGVLKFAPLEDMLELNMNHRDWVMERIARAERSHELLLRQEQEKELAKQMTYDRGLSQ